MLLSEELLAKSIVVEARKTSRKNLCSGDKFYQLTALFKNIAPPDVFWKASFSKSDSQKTIFKEKSLHSLTDSLLQSLSYKLFYNRFYTLFCTLFYTLFSWNFSPFSWNISHTLFHWPSFWLSLTLTL